MSSPPHEHQVNLKLILTGEKPGPSKEHPLPKSAVVLKAELDRNRGFCRRLVQGPCLVLECSRYSNLTSHHPQWQKRGTSSALGNICCFLGTVADRGPGGSQALSQRCSAVSCLVVTANGQKEHSQPEKDLGHPGMRVWVIELVCD